MSTHQHLITNSRKLRTTPTNVEKKLWQHIKSKQLGKRFYRQRIVDDKYIVDFYCAEAKLIIELDGSQHCESKEDKVRDEYLTGRGYKVLRFWNNEINDNLAGCLEVIRNHLL